MSELNANGVENIGIDDFNLQTKVARLKYRQRMSQLSEF